MCEERRIRLCGPISMAKKLVDVVQAALDNHMMVEDLKKKLIEENSGHIVTFKVE